MPAEQWRKIVDFVEDVCGTDESEIEILQGVDVYEDPIAKLHKAVQERTGSRSDGE